MCSLNIILVTPGRSMHFIYVLSSTFILLLCAGAPTMFLSTAAHFCRFVDCDVLVSEVRETSRKPDEMYPLLERLSPGVL
jgi:N6-adenosine-specific RNA methylase IME4